MSFDQQMQRLFTAARDGSRGIERDKCLVYRDDLNELINQFLELERRYKERIGAA